MCPLEDLVHIDRGAAEQLDVARRVRHESAPASTYSLYGYIPGSRRGRSRNPRSAASVSEQEGDRPAPRAPRGRAPRDAQRGPARSRSTRRTSTTGSHAPPCNARAATCVCSQEGKARTGLAGFHEHAHHARGLGSCLLQKLQALCLLASGPRVVNPVMFPPGPCEARDAFPLRTGITGCRHDDGDRLGRSHGRKGARGATSSRSTSGLRRTSSAARAGKPIVLPLRPSILDARGSGPRCTRESRSLLSERRRRDGGSSSPGDGWAQVADAAALLVARLPRGRRAARRGSSCSGFPEPAAIHHGEPRIAGTGDARRATWPAAISSSDHTWSAMPASMAGVTRSVLWLSTSC